MTESWQTIEQAAVTLGLSVRTVNRHITNGKLSSRLFEGRREVLIPADMLSGRVESSSGATASVSAQPKVTAAAPAEELSDSKAEEPQQANTASQSRTTFSADLPPEKPLDLQTMLTLADSIDDKASLAVTAYQTLARSAEMQAQSLRRVAFGAWAAVGVLAVGVVIATGWGVRTLTAAESNAEQLSRSLAEQREINKQEIARRESDLRRLSTERDSVRQELTDIRSQSDVLRGRVEVLTEQQRHAQATAEMAAYVLRQGVTTRPAIPASQPSASPITAAPEATLASTTVPPTSQPSAAPVTQPAADVPAAAPVTRPTAGPASKPFAHPPRPAYTNEPDLLDPR